MRGCLLKSRLDLRLVPCRRAAAASPWDRLLDVFALTLDGVNLCERVYQESQANVFDKIQPATGSARNPVP